MPNNGGVYSNVQHGNPLLKAEESETWTLGVVWQSQGERSFTVSADYYDILIEEAVGNLDFQTAYRQCFNYTGVENPTYTIDNSYCQFINRNPETAESAFVEAVNFNLGQISTKGVDFDVSWRHDLAGGDFSIRSSLNRLLEWKSFDVPGSPLYDYADSTAQGGLYDWQAFTTFAYSTDRYSVGLNMRYLPEVRNAALVQTPNANILNTEAYNVFNLNGTWSFNPKLRLRFGIDNLLDERAADRRRSARREQQHGGHDDLPLRSARAQVLHRHVVGLLGRGRADDSALACSGRRHGAKGRDCCCFAGTSWQPRLEAPREPCSARPGCVRAAARAEARADGVAALGDDLFRITVGQRSVVALTGREGVALVNGGAASESAGLIEAVADLPNGGEVRTLFNTCWHPEHTGSNEVWAGPARRSSLTRTRGSG